MQHQYFDDNQNGWGWLGPLKFVHFLRLFTQWGSTIKNNSLSLTAKKISLPCQHDSKKAILMTQLHECQQMAVACLWMFVYKWQRSRTSGLCGDVSLFTNEEDTTERVKINFHSQFSLFKKSSFMSPNWRASLHTFLWFAVAISFTPYSFSFLMHSSSQKKKRRIAFPPVLVIWGHVASMSWD